MIKDEYVQSIELKMKYPDCENMQENKVVIVDIPKNVRELGYLFGVKCTYELSFKEFLQFADSPRFEER